MGSSRFAEAHLGAERLAAASFIARHRHAHGYIALVLEGHYTEAGDEGRRRLSPGDALVHHAFDAHLDRIGRHGAQVLNLPLPRGVPLPTAFRVLDADAIARLAESDVAAAATLLCTSAMASSDPAPDWPDLLAAALRSHPETRLTDWAHDNGLATATLSRGFRSVFGVSPARYRAEARARHAFALLVRGDEPLVDVALSSGFADQAHLSRAITQLTGLSPSAWRYRSNLFKTAQPASA